MISRQIIRYKKKKKKKKRGEEEEEITVRKGTKRKRGHECDVCEKVFETIQFGYTHAYSHERETV